MTTRDRQPPKIARVRHEAWASRSILRVIRAHCFECVGGVASQIPGCTSPDCPLHPFRCVESIRQGFNAAADALEAKGLAELAARSRDLLAANRRAWAERETVVPEAESAGTPSGAPDAKGAATEGRSE